MPRGASPKRERQYRRIKESGKKRGMSEGRAEEMAARTVNKQRAESGEATSSSRSRSRRSTAKRATKRAATRRTSTRRTTAKRTTARATSTRATTRRRTGRSGSRRSTGRTREQLYQEAKRRNIRGRSRMTKSQLQRALSR
jgi:hypothetical protein